MDDDADRRSPMPVAPRAANRPTPQETLGDGAGHRDAATLSRPGILVSLPSGDVPMDEHPEMPCAKLPSAGSVDEFASAVDPVVE
jgi:hypothetical protein